jgi:hypothetical protein
VIFLLQVTGARETRSNGVRIHRIGVAGDWVLREGAEPKNLISGCLCECGTASVNE